MLSLHQQSAYTILLLKKCIFVSVTMTFPPFVWIVLLYQGNLDLTVQTLVVTGQTSSSVDVVKWTNMFLIEDLDHLLSAQ